MCVFTPSQIAYQLRKMPRCRSTLKSNSPYLQFIFVSVGALLFSGVARCSVEEEVNKLKELTKSLAQQTMMQQLFIEERIRSDGQSGIKQKRIRYTGSRPYHSDTFTHTHMAQIHDHANHERTIGMGEFVAVLNGVEFRTRHNDYGLYSPSHTSRQYNAITPIDTPEVPPEVLKKRTVDEQSEEMRAWFKAWKDQDHSVRDYRKYFKPVLCYLEGAWTIPKPDQVDEPFVSDRHYLDTLTWNELHRKIRFMSNTGSKDNQENFAYLPTAVIDMVNNDTEPVFAQWTYRIMCHPLKRYVHLNRLRPVDDLAPRVAYGFNRETHGVSRSARFELNTKDSPVFRDAHVDRKFMDDLMGEIPGMDNYGRFLTDSSFGLDCMDAVKSERKLNAAYYHRRYIVKKKSANGRQMRNRGFSDDAVYMAMNTQDRVATQTVWDKCKRTVKETVRCNKEYSQKWSYAIPLELIYLTPLAKWNPYGIIFNATGEQCRSCRGGRTKGTAYRVASSKYFYRTPASFFTGKKSKGDEADTSGRSVGMLNKKGEVCVVRASGVYIKIPDIQGIGVLRQRFPIAPVHQEGNVMWKELQALKDLVLDQSQRFARLRADYSLTSVPGSDEGLEDEDLLLQMSYATPDADSGVTEHTHTVQLNSDEVKALKNGKTVKVTTSTDSGHSHQLILKYFAPRKQPFNYIRCDSKRECWDKHDKPLSVWSDS